MITNERLREIAKLCDEATPGPWRWGDWRAAFGLLESEFKLTLEHNQTHGAETGSVPRYRDDGCIRVLAVEDEPENTADIRFIAASRSLVPELLAEVHRLRSALAKWQSPCADVGVTPVDWVCPTCKDPKCGDLDT